MAKVEGQVLGLGVQG